MNVVIVALRVVTGYITFLKIREFCRKSAKIIENFNFAIRKKEFSNFVGPPLLNRDRWSAVVLFYLTTRDKLENAIFRERMMMAPPPSVNYG